MAQCRDQALATPRSIFATAAALSENTLPALRCSLSRCGRSSVVVGAAVDVDGLARNEAAVLANQKQTGRGDLVDMALTPERDALGVWQPVAVPLRIVAACVDAAGR